MTNNVNIQSVLTFNGQDDYIDFGKNDIGGVFAEGSSAFTISGWVNPHRLTNKATTYGTRNVFLARSSDRYSDNFEFGISEENNLDIYIDENVDNAIKTLGNGELTLQEWHFFAIVFNCGQLTIYLDGHEYSESLAGPFLNKATSRVTLGATLHNRIYFTGQLANISVWNYPCPKEEIQKHRDQHLVGNEQGLVAYWKLNEGQGKTVRDQTGNAHDGTLHGNPRWDLVKIPFMVAQSSHEDKEQDQQHTVISSEEASQAVAEESGLENLAQEQESKDSPDLSELPAEVVDIEVTAKPVSVEVSPIIETEVVPTQFRAATSTRGGKVKKGARKKSANIPTSSTTSSLAEKKAKILQISESEVLVDIPQQEEPQQTLTQQQAQKNMSTKSKAKYKILAIDGGGIRGIIPALILAEIEKRTQKQIFSLFDLIAGTSSGGILALGLTKPRLNTDPSNRPPAAQYSAEELLQIFVEYGAEIFYEPFWEQVLGSIEDIFLQPKYSSEGREEILKKYFGNTLLKNNLKEVFVTSYDIEKRIPVFFTNKLEKQQIESRNFHKLCLDFTLTDAALATSATPTYFAPYRVPNNHNSKGFYTLIDGGIVANNPANLAILEAQTSIKENKQILNTDDVLVVSLGTGSLTSVYSYNEVKNWGLLQWGRPLLNMVLDGGSEVVAGELERLFEPSDQETKSSYYRFQTFLTNDLEAIDNTNPENIRQLQSLAHRLIAERSQEIDELCDILSN